MQREGHDHALKAHTHLQRKRKIAPSFSQNPGLVAEEAK